MVSKLHRSQIYDIYDEYSAMPGAQRTLIKVTRILFATGLECGWIATAPEVKQLRRDLNAKSMPYVAWTDAHIHRFREMAAQYATQRPERRFVGDALEIALATGQRMDDICNQMRMDGWDGEYFEFTQSKTGARIRFKPSGVFWQIIQSRIGEKYVLAIPPPNHGRLQRLRYHFDAVREMANVDPTFHGLRKTVAIKLTEAGATSAQAAALLGHKTRRMVEEYASEAKRIVLATAAANMMAVMEF